MGVGTAIEGLSLLFFVVPDLLWGPILPTSGGHSGLSHGLSRSHSCLEMAGPRSGSMASPWARARQTHIILARLSIRCAIG